MFEEIEQALPAEWKGLYRVLVLPISWLPSFQSLFFDLVWNSMLPGGVLFKRIFLVLPALGIMLGLWCSMLSVYTLIFRSSRLRFGGSLIVAWWDILRCTWFFWAGMGKFIWMLFGSLWGLLRLMVGVVIELIREFFELPFVLTGTITRNLRSPGVPWLAFLMTMAWSALEALIFTYILTPTISEIMSDLVGTESHRFLPFLLFIFLFIMIAGSFACLHVLVEAFNKKNWKDLIQMGIIEVIVMMVETVFLYRELVDALTPWIAQQTGVRMGLVPVILFASFGWVGIRGMVWFLFARFGTPTLLAIIARQRLTEDEEAAAPSTQADERWGVVVGKIKAEQDWFQAKGEALLAAAVLPIFQVVAASLNFCFVLFLGRSVFTLPFKTLSDVMETRGLLEYLVGSGGDR